MTQLEKEQTMNFFHAVWFGDNFQVLNFFCFGNRSSKVTRFEPQQIRFHVLVELFMICLIASKWDENVKKINCVESVGQSELEAVIS